MIEQNHNLPSPRTLNEVIRLAQKYQIQGILVQDFMLTKGVAGLINRLQKKLKIVIEQVQQK